MWLEIVFYDSVVGFFFFFFWIVCPSILWISPINLN